MSKKKSQVRAIISIAIGHWGNIWYNFSDESGADSDVEDDNISPASSVNDKRSVSSPEPEAELTGTLPYPLENKSTESITLLNTFAAPEEASESVYDPPLELQIPSAMESEDSPLPSPASSPSTESDLNSPEFQPSSIVSIQTCWSTAPLWRNRCNRNIGTYHISNPLPHHFNVWVGEPSHARDMNPFVGSFAQVDFRHEHFWKVVA